MSQTAQKPRKLRTIRGYTDLARYHATVDVTALEYHTGQLPHTPYAYSLHTPVYVDATGQVLTVIRETAHRVYEVWLVDRDLCERESD